MAKTSTLLPIGLVLSSLVLVGCGSTSNSTRSAGATDLMKRTEALKAQEASLAKRQSELASAQQTISQRNAALAAREAELKAAARSSATTSPIQNASVGSGDDQLLPPQAKAGECYARVYTPPKYKVVSERVLKNAETSKVEIIPARYEKGTERLLVRAESKKIQVIPATYKTVTERVLVRAASKKLVQVPAQYDNVSERVLVKAGYTTWKKGTGPIQKIDSSTGEIMCLVEVPPVYKTITKRVQKAAPTTREVAIPAEYRTVRKQVVATEAQTREVVIPAQYKTITVTKVAEPAREVARAIPATYQTVERREMISAGGLEWRSILCETNMTRTKIMDIQRALASAGYNPGPIDGSIQGRTMNAVNAYQRAKGLPVDKYLNIQTVKALGVE